MYKVYTFFLSLLLFSLTSCNNDEFTLGEQWVNPKIRIIRIDTLTMELSTVLGDSISTGGQDALVLGQFNDKTQTGKTIASPHFLFDKPNLTSIKIQDEDYFDSLVIEFRSNGEYTGDTLTQQSFSLYRLAERLELRTDQKGYFNTSKYLLESTPLTTTTLTAYPNYHSQDTDGNVGIDYLRVKLPNSLGKEIFEKIKDNHTDLESNENFLNYLKGLAFVPESGSLTDYILGVKADTSFKMRLYYHEEGASIKEKSINFTLSTTNKYSNVSTDRTGTLLADFGGEEEINSSQTKDMAYVQSISALHMKISFPHIGELSKIGSYGIIEQAILRIKPVGGTYGQKTPLPKVLSMYAKRGPTDNDLLLSDEYGTGQTGSLRIDEVYNENTYYSYDITSFLNSQLIASANKRGYLILKHTTADASKKMERVILGNSYFSEGNLAVHNRIKVEIFYTVYNEK